MTTVLQAALNGARSPREHPAIPRTPAELAAAARASVDAGARTLHLHAYDDDGRETLDAKACAETLRAVRAACPGVPISMTTVEGIAADPAHRLELIARWTELPDLVTANMGETGIGELCEHLLGRGVGIEAGVLSVGDAEAFVRSGLAGRCERVLVEPLDLDPDDAVEHAAAIEAVVTAAGIELEQVHHGDGLASWAVCRRGLRRGHGIRTGLEDTLVLSDGTRARDNAHLVAHATRLIAESSAGA
ncbi:MAG TPA: 3-keto-5-aminohexanoate cleavage protein [Actinomycetota bacterium]|nr:3-keto-5-aminohexanoate cleavage protein [Actinomycetota bacterium]